MKTFRVVLLPLTALACCLIASPVEGAAKKAAPKTASKKASPKKAVPKKTAAPAQPAAESPWRRTPYVGALAADEKGRVLFSANADQLARPASVTKLMTALLVLEDVAAGRYGFGDSVTPSAVVYKSEPSSMDLKPGVAVTVEQLLSGLMVRSANDSALALAEWSAKHDGSPDGEKGAVSRFVARMNARAAALGMTKTKYFNPNGLPPNKKFDTTDFNVTTCSDQLKLALALTERPEIFRFTSLKTWTMPNGQVAVNHNNVMVKDKLKIKGPDGKESVDGFKTGYINAGGSSVVLTGTRNGRRAFVIVLGSASAAMRDEQARNLMSDALGSL